MPLVTNVAASLPRIAKVAGWAQRDLEQRLIDAYDQPLSPVIRRADSAPVREIIERGDDVDLGRLPMPLHDERNPALHHGGYRDCA